MLISDVYLWLAYSRISVQNINKLLENYTPAALWESFSEEGRYSLDDKTFTALKRTHSADFIERTKQYLEVNHIEYVTRADPLYPEALAQKEVGPPPVLFYKGSLDIFREPCLAVVGTRHATRYGKYAVDKIVGELAESFTIVSGLATGIDGFAHTATLRAGGRTAAVLGSGLFNVSPASHIALFDEICEKGCVLSEYPPDTHATAYTFPQRNRIISGLCKGVLVIEAGERSGSLITANCALDQGRDVFAVPGDIDEQRSIGTNRLIKQGAVAVTCAADIYGYYGQTVPERANKAKQAPPTFDLMQRRVLDVLGGGEKSFDELVENCGMSIADLNTALSSLMIFGAIREKAKNIFCATDIGKEGAN